MIDTANIEKLVDKCAKEKITGVFCGVSPFNLNRLHELCTKINLPVYFTNDSRHYEINKSEFKSKCKEFNVPIAKDFFISEKPTQDEINNITYPVVIKPTDKSANVGVHYCSSPDNFLELYRDSINKSNSGNVIIEKQMNGREYTAWYAMTNGEIRLINFYAMFNQPGFPRNCYSISTSITDKLHQYIKEVDPFAKKLLGAMGCKEGVAWIEFMADTDGKLYALEMGQRLSGELIWLGFDSIRKFNPIDWMLNYCFYNNNNDISKLPSNQLDYLDKQVCSYILWTKRQGVVTSVIGGEIIENNSNFYYHQLVKSNKSYEKFKYAAIIVFTGNSCEEIISNIKYINSVFDILDSNGNSMIIKYNDFDSIIDIDKNRD